MAAFYDAAESFFCHYVSIFKMADYLLSLRRLNHNSMEYAYRTYYIPTDSVNL